MGNQIKETFAAIVFNNTRTLHTNTHSLQLPGRAPTGGATRRIVLFVNTLIQKMPFGGCDGLRQDDESFKINLLCTLPVAAK